MFKISLDLRSRPLVLLCRAIGCAACMALSINAIAENDVADSPGRVDSKADARESEVAQEPTPQLTPEDVARAQMKALSGTGPVGKRIASCYRFASPANREHTGPIEHFSQMVQAPLYAPLLDAKHFLIGRAAQQNDEAFLLVTAIDASGQLSLFRFFLSKQAKSPYSGCWMTDAVVRIGVMNKPGESEKPINDGEPI